MAVIREWLLTPEVVVTVAIMAWLMAALALVRIMWLEDVIAKRYRHK